MKLKKIVINNFRNIKQQSFEFSEEINIICGENGSGKTSLLETIYYLSHLKSFRSHLYKQLVQYEQSAFTLYAIFQDAQNQENTLGIEKTLQGEQRVKCSFTDTNTSADLVKALPISLIEPESFSLLTDGPRQRRAFIDWGLFYTEPLFFSLWQKYQRVLKQRNELLRTIHNIEELRSAVQIWDHMLVDLAYQLNDHRQNYVNQILNILQNLAAPYLAVHEVNYRYYPGWNAEENLAQLLKSSLESDQRVRFTAYGSHRADLKFMMHRRSAIDYLSRGQQKLFICLLKCSQIIYLEQQAKQSVFLLIDDLGSELDAENFKNIFNLFKQKTKSQIFLTSLSLTNEITQGHHVIYF